MGKIAPNGLMRSRFDDADIEMGANAAILAMDGKLSRADAKMIARVVFESLGLEKRNVR